jgi:MFS family permease
MFSAVIFVPRFYQVVRGVSATASGYSMWPLLVGLIGSSIGSGIMVSRIGRYKLLLVIAMATLVVGMLLMTGIQSDTPTPLLWLWMALVGLGIGPSMSVLTVVVQNAAPQARLGTATSTLTFLRQVGGSVGLALAGTIFSQAFTSKLPQQLHEAGVPDQLAARLSSSAGFSQSDAQAVGDLGQIILQHTPAQARSLLAPYIGRIVDGFHSAFSLAVGTVFWLAVIAAGLAFVATLVIEEVPLRGATAPAEPPGGRDRRGEQADSAVPVPV